jgi:hypothetical protein
MEPAPSAGQAFFPLDEQLALGTSALTPRGQETLVRLATWMPFEQARELLADLMGIQVSKATARRMTLQTGESALADCEEQEQHLKADLPPAPAGADKQAVSADGAFVHLVGGEWAEVKTLSIGEVSRNKRGEVLTEHVSTFSRLAEAERFTQASLVETQRRGLEQAGQVCAVQDGAVWLQGLVDYHRADAVRILDFAHASEYINEIGQEVAAQGGKLPKRWLEGVLHRLKHQGPTRVLQHLQWLAARYPSSTIQSHLAYLQKREAHMQYPTYQTAGWPIGSGSVESANKVVVEARLKGAGMRWQEHNVNPMLVLRNAVCNRRWKQTWSTTQAQQAAVRRSRRQAESQQRLSHALWTLACFRVRLARLSLPQALASPSVPAPAPLPVGRSGTGYSWRKPFLRRPPSTPLGSLVASAKK